MKRHWNIFLATIKYHLEYFYQYRFSSFIHFVSSLLWFVLGMAGISIILGNVENVGGWSKEEMYILMLIFYLHTALVHALFYSSLRGITRKVRNGDLDMVLLKPVGTRFWLSIDRIVLPQFLRFIFVIVLFIGYLRYIGFVPHFVHVLYASVLFLLGIVHFYLFFFLLMMSAFWIINAWNIPFLVDRFTNAAEMPIGAFNKRIQTILTFVLPMAFIAYFPALAFLGRAPWYLIPIAIGIALVFWVLNQFVWTQALRRYSSASS